MSDRRSHSLFRETFKRWPTFKADPEPPALKAWGLLSDDEKHQAVELLDAYVCSVKATGRRHICAFSSYLREKRWQKLDGDEVAKARAGQQAAAEAAQKPDDWGPAFGPVWMAARLAYLLQGAMAVVPKAALTSGHWMASDRAKCFPAVDQIDKSVSRGGWKFGNRFHAVKALLEAVPIESEAFAAWQAFHRERGWPWIPSHDGMRVVYFPKGGPEGLASFERVLKQAGNGGDNANAA